MSQNVHVVTEASFKNEVIDSSLPVLVDFWAEWCGPCKSLAPTIETIANENHGKIKVCKVDIDSNSNIAGQFGIRSIPTMLFFKAGTVVDKLVGNVPKNSIEATIKKLV